MAKEVGCSQSAVSKHINRKLSGREKFGRKRCTSSRDGPTLQRIVRKRPIKSVGESSRATTQRRILDMGFKCCIPFVKPLLNNKHCQKRLTWADWSVAQRSNVLFADGFLILIWELRSQILEEEWRGKQSKMIEVQCEVPTVFVDLGSHDI